MKRSTKVILGIILIIMIILPSILIKVRALNESEIIGEEEPDQREERDDRDDIEEGETEDVPQEGNITHHENGFMIEGMSAELTGVGRDVTLEISFLNSVMESFNFSTYVKYDPQVLEFKSVTANKDWENKMVTEDVEEGKKRISCAYDTQVIDGNIIYITFTILKDAKSTIVELIDPYMFAGMDVLDGRDMQIEIEHEPVAEGQVPDEQLPEVQIDEEKYQVVEEEGFDMSLVKMPETTTIDEFLQSVSTEGEVTIEKEDGTVVDNTEKVGTGMILKVIKDNKEVSMTLIVKQDLDGDGDTSASDLSRVVSDLTGERKLTNIEVMASDVDDDKTNTVSDLSSMVEVLANI